MNFIMGSLLHHAGSQPVMAFRIFMLLVKNYKFETIYGENLTGYMEQITQLERYQTISDSDYKERL